MTTKSPTTIERERALAWIAEQLRWERTLSRLRAEAAGEPVRRIDPGDERQAA
jgi:hypothetical protein